MYKVKVKVKTGYLYSGTVKLDRNRWVLLILLRFARPQCLAATHLSSPEVGNGLSWPKPQCTCNAMVTSQTQHSINEGVLRSNSACSMLMSDDLRLPKRGIEPRPSGFRDIGSTSRLSPLPIKVTSIHFVCDLRIQTWMESGDFNIVSSMPMMSTVTIKFNDSKLQNSSTAAGPRSSALSTLNYCVVLHRWCCAVSG